jgi:chromosome segregation ATPase
MAMDKGLKWVAAAAGLALLFQAGGAVSAGEKKGGRERELAFRLQQMQQEKAKLEQEKGELSAKVGELGDQAKQHAGAEEKAKRELAAARRETGDLSGRLKAAEAGGRDLSSRLDATSAKLVEREREKTALEGVVKEQLQTIARQSQSLEGCNAKNAQLQAYGGELLRQLKREALEGGDALLGLGRIGAFDAYQDYQDKLDAQRTDTPAGSR